MWRGGFTSHYLADDGSHYVSCSLCDACVRNDPGRQRLPKDWTRHLTSNASVGRHKSSKALQSALLKASAAAAGVSHEPKTLATPSSQHGSRQLTMEGAQSRLVTKKVSHSRGGSEFTKFTMNILDEIISENLPLDVRLLLTRPVCLFRVHTHRCCLQNVRSKTHCRNANMVYKGMAEELYSRGHYAETLLPSALELHLNDIRSELSHGQPYVLIIDGATTKGQGRSLISIVLVYMAKTEDGVHLCRRMIDLVQPLHFTKSAEVQADCVKDSLAKIDLRFDDEAQQMADDRLVGLTSDNAADAVAVASLLGTEHLPCLAHTINLSFKKAISTDDMKPLLQPFLDVERFFRVSAKRKFLLALARGLAIRQRAMIDASGVNPEDDDDEEYDARFYATVQRTLQGIAARNKAVDPVTLHFVKLRQTPKTRFVYITDLLGTIVADFDAIRATLDAARPLIKEDAVPELEAYHKSLAEGALKFLLPIRQAVERMSGSLNPSLAVSARVYWNVVEACQRTPGEAEGLSHAKDIMCRDISTRVSQWSQYRHNVECAAVLLDPAEFWRFYKEQLEAGAMTLTAEEEKAPKDDDRLYINPPTEYIRVRQNTVRLALIEYDKENKAGSASTKKKARTAASFGAVAYEETLTPRQKFVQKVEREISLVIGAYEDAHEELEPEAPVPTVQSFWTPNRLFVLPILARLLARVIIVPATNVACESSFSVVSHVLGSRLRESLKPSTLRALVILRYNRFDAVQNMQRLAGRALSDLETETERVEGELSVAGAGAGAGAGARVRRQ